MACLQFTKFRHMMKKVLRNSHYARLWVGEETVKNLRTVWFLLLSGHIRAPNDILNIWCLIWYKFRSYEPGNMKCSLFGTQSIFELKRPKPTTLSSSPIFRERVRWKIITIARSCNSTFKRFIGRKRREASEQPRRLTSCFRCDCGRATCSTLKRKHSDIPRRAHPVKLF